MLESKIAQAGEGIFSTILEQLRLPVFVLEKDATVRYANAAAMATLGDGGSFILANGVLSMENASDSGGLKLAIANACSKGIRETIMISEFSHHKPQLVTIMPMHEAGSPAESKAIVVVLRCHVGDGVFVQALHQLFRLSAAETAIAGSLVCGEDAEHIAESRGAKIATVRTQIGAIMLKTRTRRQGELVALLSRISSLP